MSDTRKRTILIVLTGSLGDVVRGLPLVDAIKSAEPQTHISWLIEDKWQKVVALHPAIDQLLVFNRKQGLRGVCEIFRRLRREKFDVVLDLQRHFKSGFFSRSAPAMVRVGFHRRDSKEGNWLFNNRYIEYRGNTISKVDHYLLFLDAIGIPRPEKLSFGFERLDAVKLAGPFSIDDEAPHVALVLGSSWNSKDWLSEGYERLIELIKKSSSAKICLVGDNSQRSLAEELERTLGTSVRNLVGKTSLPELVGVLLQCRAAVGPDSGPGHISAAVGTPYVTLFGPTDPLRVEPYGMGALSIRAGVGCSPCWRRTCPGLNKICMRSITAEQVFQKLEMILR